MSGWQRLWVLVSAILLIPTIFLAIVLQPSVYEINQEKKGKLIEFAVNNDPAVKGSKASDIAEAYKDVAPDLFVEKLKEKYSTTHPDLIAGMEAVLREVNQDFIWSRYSAIAKAFVAWLSVVLIIYGLGFGIGWVYRGFKKEGAT